MSNIKNIAKEYLKAGLSVVFLQDNKISNLSGWESLQKKALEDVEVETLFSGGSIRKELEFKRKKKTGEDFTVKGINFYPEKNPSYLGIIGGKVSGGLEVVDVDCKYDLTGALWEDFSGLLRDNLSDIYSSLLIAKTVSGGYHIYYRCEIIEGNLKLAERPTTEEEREGNKNDKVRVLIETRGEGGYVVAPPSKGYEFIQGDLYKIPTISTEQRACIFAIARDFNQIEETPSPQIKKATYSPTPSGSEITSLEDYANRGDAVELLKSHGWIEVGTSGERVNLLRPGDTSAKSSGNYHLGKRCLIVFSTSTQFEPGKPYSPSEIFNLLECRGDWKETAKKLGALGYGSKDYKKTSSKEVKTEKIKVEVVNPVNRESSVIYSPGDTLRMDTIKTAIGEEVIITSPGPEAKEEVLKAIALLLETGKRIYIKEGKEEPIREYKYQLKAIFDKYTEIEEREGYLSDINQDRFLEEIVITAHKLELIDRDIFKKSFLSLEPIKEMGITEESLSITVDRLTSTKEKEAQARDFKKLLDKAKEHQDKGEIKEALELLDSKVKDIRITGASDLLPPPMSFTTLLDEIATLPPAYKTGYNSLDNFVGFTPGAITLIAGRPSHGKTTFMFNLLLQMSDLYKDENFYFFSYEEPVKNISVKLLNRLIDKDLSGYYREVKDLPKPTNYEFIKHYIKARRTDIQQIEEGKRQLRELIDSQRIRVIDRSYSVEELYSLISYLRKKERIGAVFIDYIQRMRTDAKTQDMRTKIAHISDSVLQIAKDSGLPIILGAQLNRATTIGGNKKPTLENLKEAGNLEEDANTVLSVYCKAREEEETDSGDQSSKLREVELEIKALKNREGEVNTKEILSWDRWTGVVKDQ
jgi:replicative DNA helicase